jgi:hypothetical protein
MASDGPQPCRPLRSEAQVQPQSQLPPLAQEQVLEQPQPQGHVAGWVRGVEQVQAMVILLVGDGLRIASGASAPPTPQPCTLPSSGESREQWAGNRPSPKSQTVPQCSWLGGLTTLAVAALPEPLPSCFRLRCYCPETLRSTPGAERW